MALEASARGSAFINNPIKLCQHRQTSLLAHRNAMLCTSYSAESSADLRPRIPPSTYVAPAGLKRRRRRGQSCVESDLGNESNLYPLSVPTTSATMRWEGCLASTFAPAGIAPIVRRNRRHHILPRAMEGVVPGVLPLRSARTPYSTTAVGKSGRQHKVTHVIVSGNGSNSNNGTRSVSDGGRLSGRDGAENKKHHHKRKNASDTKRAQKEYMRRIQEVGLGGRWREVQALLDEMRAAGVPLNIIVYNAAISALARCRKPADAEGLLDEMLDKDNLAPDTISYNSAINAHARMGDLAAASRVLELMRSRSVQPDVFTFNTLADAAAKKADPVAATKILRIMAEEGVTPEIITYNSCLNACAKKGDLRRATALLGLMREDGLDPDQRSYAAIISSAGRCGQWKRVPDLLAEMRDAGLRPDRVTFNTAIAALGTGGQWQLATLMLDEMNAAGLPPDTVNYTAALVACGHAGKWELSLRLLKDMDAAGVTPNAHSYSAAMDACSKAGQQERALSLLAEMQERGGLMPDTVAYNSAIDACSVTGDWSTALRLLSEMKEGTGGAADAPPDVVSYGGAITACARAGRVNEALRLVAELRSNEAQAAEAAVRGTPLTRDVSNVRDHKPSMQKKNGSSMRSNVSNMREDSADSGATTTGGVKSPGKALGRIQSNVRSSGESRRSGTFPLPLPNLVTYSAALFACLKVGDVHRGTELLDEMIAAGIKPNRIHCDTLIAAWSAAGEPERAISVMRRLQEHNGFEPSLATFEAIVWGHAQVADWESAVRLLAYILHRGLKPSTRSWDAAIAACSQAGHWERALALLADMRRQGVFPSRVTYTAAVAGLNRPRYAEWGPKLEKLARLLQNRADASYEAWRSRGGGGDGDEKRERKTVKDGFAGENVRRATRATRISGPAGKGTNAVEDDTLNDSPNGTRNVVGDGPSIEDFDGSIEALGNAGQANGAACLLRVMRREGFHASPRAYRSVIYACARVGLLSEAVALAKEMDAENHILDQNSRSRQSPPQSGSNTAVTTERAPDLDASVRDVDGVSAGEVSKSGSVGVVAGVDTGGGADQARTIGGDAALGAVGEHESAFAAASVSTVRTDRDVEIDKEVDVKIGDIRVRGDSGTSIATATATATDLNHHGSAAEDDGEYDLLVVYNCIVCNFASAAASGALDEARGADSGCNDGVGTEQNVDAFGFGVGVGGDESHRGKVDEAEIFPLLMGVTERAEGALENEAASGGVVVAEKLESLPAAASAGMENLLFAAVDL